MKKKTKKAAKKPRPKTVTVKMWCIVDTRDSRVCSGRFPSRSEALKYVNTWKEHYVPARVTITYEVRR